MAGSHEPMPPLLLAVHARAGACVSLADVVVVVAHCVCCVAVVPAEVVARGGGCAVAAASAAVGSFVVSFSGCASPPRRGGTLGVVANRAVRVALRASGSL